MAKNPSGLDETPRDTESKGTEESTIAEVMSQVVTRDQVMWEQLTRRDTELQGRMMDLFSQLLGTNSLDRVLANGLGELIDQLKEQLAPLRELARPRADLDEGDDARLASLNRALRRPNFGGPPESDAPFWIETGASEMDRRSYTR